MKLQSLRLMDKWLVWKSSALCLSFFSKIILRLMQSLLNQGYILGVDKFYTQPELFETVLDSKTDAVSTVRSNIKLLSHEVKSKVVKKGETIVEYKHKMMHMKWRDKNYVNMLSTIYEDSMEEVKRTPKSLQ